ncbi:MAG TPA: M48 family metallopeptidase [Pseudomonadota bacterium]|nr:M48 family metallopeptidase [Rhodanobacteraceae bacterium]HQW82428.1 M48 family metallopeptidase [Pseudomonadota bacterium]
MDARFGMSGQRRRGGMRWWVLVLFAGYLGYYWLSHRHEASFTGRAQMVDTTMDQEVALGLQSFEQILEQSQVLRSGETVNDVREIARRLIDAGPKLEKYLVSTRGIVATTPWDKFEWEVAVIDSDQANAFCLPGGKMAVYTGILPIAQNDDALAIVMGHEIAHAVLRHGAERMAQQKLVQLGSVAAGMSTSDMDARQRQLLMAAIGVGTQYGLTLPFSRSHETEADHVGLMLAAAACFDPSASIGLWQRMGAEAAGNAPPEFMSTHPSSNKRIQRLQGWMDEANQIRAQFCENPQ